MQSGRIALTRALAWGSFLSLALAGCAPLPKAPVERALYADARKALRSEWRLGWTIDRVELEEAAVHAEPSACEVSPERRRALRAWVDAAITKRGGPGAAQFARGVPRSALDEVIELERTRALLDQVERHIPADCPFWVTPRDDFRGLHATTERWVLIAESMGEGSLLLQGGQVRAAAGGAARLFAGYGLSDRLLLALGIETGGDAVLQKEDRGAYAPEGAFRFGVPALLRWSDLDRIYDLELAAVTRLGGGALRPWGARIALAGGVSGLRRLGFMPALELYVGYELFPAQGREATEHVLRLGTRVGFDWDP